MKPKLRKWPSQWGADDQMGASNHITAETILKAAQLVKTGKMYELGQVYDRDMPTLPGRTYAMFIFYNGTPVSEMKGPYGMNKLGIEHMRSFVTRGVLIDIGGYKGLEHLEHSYEVTVADIRGALAKQGIAEDSIEEGDALLFNYGWSKLWSDPDTYNTKPRSRFGLPGTFGADSQTRNLQSGEYDLRRSPSRRRV